MNSISDNNRRYWPKSCHEQVQKGHFALGKQVNLSQQGDNK